MKKYLIALPLVLIMILSMVPVMAANTINVEVKYYGTPDLKKVVKTEVRAIEVTDAELADATALKAKVEKEVAGFGFPKLDTDVQPEWTVKATVTAQSQGATTYKVLIQKVTDPTFEEIKDHVAPYGITFNTDAFSPDDLKVKVFAGGALLTKVNAKLQDIADNKNPDLEIKLVAHDLQGPNDKHPQNADLKTLQEVAGAVKDATASAIAYPNCFVDPSKPVEKWCPELCEYIVVRVFNAYNNLEIESAMRQYKVDPHKLPTFDKLYEHYMNNYFPRGYQVLKDWKNQNDIWLPTAIDRDCTIFIWVLPLNQKVNVYHVLRDCCINLDGDVEYNVWKVFEELNQTVPFIEYHTDLVINQDKAKEYATTRLQKINAMDFVFDFATFDDGVRLDNYLTGPVYDLDGRLVEVIVDETPAITIVYNRVGCQKEEEKVDNATVENTNTQAPVTASGTQLPATGAKDVTAFFLSAVALLGLGIFFAKKH